MLGFFTLLRLRSEQENANHKTPASTPIVPGTATFLMDATSGKVLIDSNSHARLPIAGIVKIMTAVVAIENANLDQYVTIEQATLNEVPRGTSTAQLQAGDQIQLRDLLYGLLLPSGSDAALVIADAVAGNMQQFVIMMNDEAHQLQLNDTHFSNPYGSSASDSYSSAANLTRLAQYAMQLSTFAQVVAQRDYALSATPHNHGYLWHTTNTLLASYPGMNGIEIGYDVQAGACMVFFAQRNNRLLIGAELHAASENELTSDVRKLLDREFAN
jgi:D-alanyl-D-alanine carboxypeptidase